MGGLKCVKNVEKNYLFHLKCSTGKKILLVKNPIPNNYISKLSDFGLAPPPPPSPDTSPTR